MPVDKDIKKVLIIGSGPIQIGQAAEFDYSGSQACKSLREEGIETVLVNSNPATIQTDLGMADTVYTEPLTPEVVAKIIKEEEIDAILPTMGGQTGLNIATGLGDLGLLEGIKVLGSDVQTIKDVEDRDLFANLMEDLVFKLIPSSGLTAVAGSSKSTISIMVEDMPRSFPSPS